MSMAPGAANRAAVEGHASSWPPPRPSASLSGQPPRTPAFPDVHRDHPSCAPRSPVPGIQYPVLPCPVLATGAPVPGPAPPAQAHKDEKWYDDYHLAGGGRSETAPHAYLRCAPLRARQGDAARGARCVWGNSGCVFRRPPPAARAGAAARKPSRRGAAKPFDSLWSLRAKRAAGLEPATSNLEGWMHSAQVTKTAKVAEGISGAPTTAPTTARRNRPFPTPSTPARRDRPPTWPTCPPTASSTSFTSFSNARRCSSTNWPAGNRKGAEHERQKKQQA